MHFLDVHAGSLQVIASLVLVVVTGVYTILTRSMAKAASEALRPYVYLDLSFNSPVEMIIVVGNSGTKVAGNVQAVLTKSNSDKIAQLVRALPITTGIGHLSPSSTRRYEIIVGNDDLLPREALATTLDFEITYYDGGRELTDRQHIDLEGYRSALVFDQDKGLSRIADRLGAIERKLPEKTIIFPGLKKPCPYCGTQIPESAKKCPSCLEWLSRSHRRIPNFRITHSRGPRAW
jgi:predicted nucleic acid-binding Zn ribbon protein